MKQLYRSLGLAVLAVPFTGVGLNQVGGNPNTAIAQTASSAPLYRTQTIPCPVVLPLEKQRHLYRISQPGAWGDFKSLWQRHRYRVY